MDREVCRGRKDQRVVGRFGVASHLGELLFHERRNEVRFGERYGYERCDQRHRHARNSGFGAPKRTHDLLASRCEPPGVVRVHRTHGRSVDGYRTELPTRFDTVRSRERGIRNLAETKPSRGLRDRVERRQRREGLHRRNRLEERWNVRAPGICVTRKQGDVHASDQNVLQCARRELSRRFDAREKSLGAGFVVANR